MPMTDEERLALAAKLDKELDDFIDGLEKRPYTEGWPEDRWQEEMEKHPFFMKKAPEAGEQLSPLMEGLQQLKYDPNENTPEELANAYKEDGNFNFKHKNYRLAIIAYTEGIKIKCGNPDVEAVLLNNRSAANYFLKNFRSALKDSEWALRYKPDYDKALTRAANCCFEIKQYDKALDFCDTILKNNPKKSEIIMLRRKCVAAKKEMDRDERKLLKKQDEVLTKETKLLGRIRELNVKIEGGLTLTNLKPQVPELSDFPVHLDGDKLVWPVVFTYPEYRVMDFVQEFREDDCFVTHLERVFEVAPEWDKERRYVVENVQLFFEGSDGGMHEVVRSKNLGEVMREPAFVVKASGTPTFIVLVRDSDFAKSFMQRNCI
ncbi:hypothetical protein FQR65_LT00202 [Abscondita terminalis]|nr:hypothetical protein FQR65_LT00202 [Abscondita terminalis]